MSAWFCRRLTARPTKRLFRLVFESHDGRALGADSEEKHEPVSDIDTVVVDSLKALDPKRPIREADINGRDCDVRFVPLPDSCTAAYSDYFDHFVGADFLERRFNAHRFMGSDDQV